MSTNAKIITKDTVTLVLNGAVFTATRETADKIGATSALQRNDLRKAADLLNREKAVNRRSAGVFIVENGVVFHNNVPVHNVIADRLVSILDAGNPLGGLELFLENLLKNPSARAVSEGYEFLENKNLPITEDGHFLAYKSVRSDYKDKYSGKFDNSVGNVVEVPRNTVDDNRERECSYGLHVGALGYSGPNGWYHGEGDKVIIVKVNPRDIVAVPKDHAAQKMRVSRYEVIGDFKSAFEAPLMTATGNEYAGSLDSDEPQVICGDIGGCGWEGDYPELEDGFRCPACGSGKFIIDTDIDEF